MFAPDSPLPPSDMYCGFIDVGAFARRAVPSAPSAGSCAYLERRRWLTLPPGSISVAAVQLDAGGERDIVLPGDEFLIVLSGQVALQQAGSSVELAANDHCLVPRGVSFSWVSNVGAQLIALRCTSGGSATLQHALKIDTEAPLVASNPPATDLLLGPVPQCRGHAAYRSPGGEFACGTWDSTPYHRRAMLFQHFELMHLLAGCVTFVDASGAAGTFSRGDVVMFVRGGTVSWESREHVKKAYAWFKPA